MNGEIDFEALGARAVACKHWRWLPGMLATSGVRASEDDPAELWADGCGALPDLRDPCTLGGLLALVRSAWGESTVLVRFDACSCTVGIGNGYGWTHEFDGDSEVEALVVALEAAMPRSAT